MNTSTLVQTNVNVKPQPTMIPSVAWAWGFEDGSANRSIYTGYHLFCGQRLTQYKAGWMEGQRVKAQRGH